jgi:hypothetical protein
VETGNRKANTKGGKILPSTPFVQSDVKTAKPEENEAVGAAQDDVPDDRFGDSRTTMMTVMDCKLISLNRGFRS